MNWKMYFYATQNSGYCLHAISGDCSAKGITDKAEIIALKKQDMPLVGKYLRNQLEMELMSVDIVSPSDYRNPASIAIVDEHNALGNAMIEQGIFSHKYHKRTKWILEESEEECV
tara:strand:- start:552 stop:896 length:345 start_codon:yes stop_codon:yes gene_type:complete